MPVLEGVEPVAVAVRARRRPVPRPAVLLSHPFWTALVACAVVAAVSAAVLPTVPSYDPWSWIVWGREVSDPHLSFTVGGGPSWKPLPVLFTSVFGLLGGAAPTLWVVAARAGGLMAFVAAFRLGAWLVASVSTGARALGGSAAEDAGGPGRHVGPAADTGAHGDGTTTPVAGSWLGPWPILAGLIAAVGVGLTQEWGYYMFRGTSEPMLVGCCLWAVERHLGGRYRSAFLLGIAASLIRPEAWPFVLLYAGWLWRGDRPFRAFLPLGLIAIPVFWFVPPWIGTGQPLLAATHAAAYNGHLGSDPFATVVGRGLDLQILPSLVLGLLAVALGWWRWRSRLLLGLAAAVAAWWVLVVAMTLDGYPGLERFFLPAAGLLCVLSGAGVVWIAQLLAGAVGGRLAPADEPRVHRLRRSPLGSATLLAGLIAAVLLAGSIPLAVSRADAIRTAEPVARDAVTRLDQLTAAVAAAGGHNAVFPCKTSFAAVNHGVQTALAWKLHVTLERVGTEMRHPGVLFVGPHDSIDGGPAPISHSLNRIVPVTHAGVWRVYRVWRAGHSLRCVGR